MLSDTPHTMRGTATALRQAATRFAVYGAPMELLAKWLEKTPKKITLPYLLANGGKPGQPATENEVLHSARHVQRELPVRLARRVRQFYSLPFIVGTNPYIQTIARLYASSFAALTAFPPIETLEQNTEFTNKLQELVGWHSENAPTLARGFMECLEYMNTEQVGRFLNAALHSRIGIRLIAEQHLALTTSLCASNTEEMPYKRSQTSVGIIDTQMVVSDVLRGSAEYVQSLCEATFDMAPEVVFEGATGVRTVGIPMHLDYAMTELLKNSFRATTERHLERKRAGTAPDTIPPVRITVADAPSHLTIRIRDEGGGISPENMSKVFNYSFTTVNHSESEDTGDVTSGAMLSGMGSLAGLGYGLPLSRLYIGYFGDSDLDIVSLWGHVCNKLTRDG